MITLVGAPQAGANTNGGDVTLTFNVAPAEGDVVVVHGGFGQDRSGADHTGVPSGYTLALDVPHTGGNPRAVWSYKRMGATPDASVTIPGTGFAQDATAALCYVLRGVDADTLLDATPTTGEGTVGTDPFQSPAITTVTDGAWVIIGVSVTDESDLAGAPSGYGNLATDGGVDSNRANVGGATKEVSTAGAETPGTWSTSTQSGDFIVATLAIRPAGGDPDPEPIELEPAPAEAAPGASLALTVTRQLQPESAAAEAEASAALTVERALAPAPAEAAPGASLELTVTRALQPEPAQATADASLELESGTALQPEPASVAPAASLQLTVERALAPEPASAEAGASLELSTGATELQPAPASASAAVSLALQVERRLQPAPAIVMTDAEAAIIVARALAPEPASVEGAAALRLRVERLLHPLPASVVGAASLELTGLLTDPRIIVLTSAGRSFLLTSSARRFALDSIRRTFHLGD